MKHFSLTGWFIILLLPFTAAQELSLLEASDTYTPTETVTNTNPLLDYVLSDDTIALCNLLSEGMNPNYILEDGQTALHYSKNAGIAALLIEYGADVNAKDDFHNTPLHHAVTDLNELLTRLLLEEGADANIQNKSYYTPLLQCLEETDKPELRAIIARLLLEYEANPNVSTQLYQNTPLYFAVQNRNQLAVSALIDHNAKLNTIQGEAGAPLDLASRYKDTLLISSLTKAGAIHIRQRENLLQAMYENDMPQISQLVESGLDLNFMFDDIQLSPLQAGIKYMNSPTVVQLFLEQGAFPDFVDTLIGNSPLHLAVDTKSELVIIQLLLEYEANLNAVDGTGKSLLYKAVELGNKPLIALFLSQGADPTFSLEGQSVLELAKASGDPEILGLFDLEGEH